MEQNSSLITRKQVKNKLVRWSSQSILFPPSKIAQKRHRSFASLAKLPKVFREAENSRILETLPDINKSLPKLHPRLVRNFPFLSIKTKLNFDKSQKEYTFGNPNFRSRDRSKIYTIENTLSVPLPKIRKH